MDSSTGRSRAVASEPSHLQSLALLAERRRGLHLPGGRWLRAADREWGLRILSAIECTDAGAILVALGRSGERAAGLVRSVSHETVGDRAIGVVHARKRSSTTSAPEPAEFAS